MTDAESVQVLRSLVAPQALLPLVAERYVVDFRRVAQGNEKQELRS